MHSRSVSGAVGLKWPATGGSSHSAMPRLPWLGWELSWNPGRRSLQPQLRILDVVAMSPASSGYFDERSTLLAYDHDRAWSGFGDLVGDRTEEKALEPVGVVSPDE